MTTCYFYLLIVSFIGHSWLVFSKVNISWCKQSEDKRDMFTHDLLSNQHSTCFLFLLRHFLFFFSTFYTIFSFSPQDKTSAEYENLGRITVCMGLLCSQTPGPLWNSGKERKKNKERMKHGERRNKRKEWVKWRETTEGTARKR